LLHCAANEKRCGRVQWDAWARSLAFRANRPPQEGLELLGTQRTEATDDPSSWLSRWVGSLSVRQRHTLGFPLPGHSYWTAETIAGVAARYPGMDMAPYEQQSMLSRL
jgi:hypothetical protein